jgi:CIC family chloride channel protein
VCELAGNYDLLVPLMLAQGIAFAALRKRGIYDEQVATPRDSPVHRDAWFLDVLKAVRVRDLGIEKRPPVLFELRTPLAHMLDRLADATWQDVFPVVDRGTMVGLVSAASIQALARDGSGATAIVAADVMQPPAAVHLDDDLRAVTERLLAHGLREIPVLDQNGQILGFLDEDELVKVHVTAAARADAGGRSETELPAERE